MIIFLLLEDEQGVNCGSQYFSCSQTKQCIPRAFVCDGENDCTDRSDEIGCGKF